ncbi:MAG: hypothetical protein J6S67_07355 [Methanobrevibacter sp.]|nr:hypothetical protein [Methanobrevibacter sp.]
MALYWDFEKDFVGHMIEKRRNNCICNLYVGNAMLIAVAETTEEYCLHWFISDEQHLKNMLADERCREDIHNLEFIFCTEALNDKNVKKAIKMLQGVATIKLLGEKDVQVTRQKYNLNKEE